MLTLDLLQAYEWALEMSKYMSRVKADDTQSPVQTLQVMKHLQQYLMAHPPIAEDHFTEMMQLARRLGNEKLMEQAKVSKPLLVKRRLSLNFVCMLILHPRFDVVVFLIVFLCHVVDRYQHFSGRYHKWVSSRGLGLSTSAMTVLYLLKKENVDDDVLGCNVMFTHQYVPAFVRLKMEAVCFSKMLLSIDESTWRHSSEDQHRHRHHHENLGSHIKKHILVEQNLLLLGLLKEKFVNHMK